MRPNRTSRRTYVAATVTAVAMVSGCTGIRDALSEQKLRRQTDLTGRSDRPFVENQPAFEAAPAAESWLVTDPEWMETNIRWKQVEGVKLSLRRMQENIDAETFLTVSAGALPYKYGLGGFGDSYLEEETMHLNTRVEKTTVDGQNESNDPSYTYDYWFILWRLLNDAKRPTEMDFNFRLGELSGDTATETTE